MIQIFENDHLILKAGCKQFGFPAIVSHPQHCVDPLDTPHEGCQIKLLSLRSDQQYRSLASLNHVLKHPQLFLIPDRHCNLLLSWSGFLDVLNYILTDR